MAPFFRTLLALMGTPSHLAHNECPDGATALYRHARRHNHHHHRRDFVWTEIHDGPQDLCGNSTFQLGAATAGGGPAAADCAELVCYARSRTGFWLVTGFGAGGLAWDEFDVLGSCKLAVRHADGGGGTIPWVSFSALVSAPCLLLRESQSGWMDGLTVFHSRVAFGLAALAIRMSST